MLMMMIMMIIMMLMVVVGVIKSYKRPYYLVEYEDGDREEMKREEVASSLIT